MRSSPFCFSGHDRHGIAGFSLGAAAGSRSRLLSHSRCRPVETSFASQHRYPHRRDGDHLRCRGECDQRGDPAEQLTEIVDNLGLPYSGINLAYSSSAPVGPGDADIFINFKKKHSSLENFQRDLRSKLAATFPAVTFSFLPADIVGQILNFGLLRPWMYRSWGPDVDGNRAFIKKLLPKLVGIPGAVDMHLQQPYDYPQLNVDVDRSKAQFLGLTEQNVAANMLVSLSGSFQTSPSFWIDPKTGTQYNVVSQTSPVPPGLAERPR